MTAMDAGSGPPEATPEGALPAQLRHRLSGAKRFADFGSRPRFARSDRVGAEKGFFLF